MGGILGVSRQPLPRTKLARGDTRMILHRGNIYLVKEHIEKLKSEEEQVQKRYQAVAKTLIPEPFRIVREKAAELLGLCKRQMQRIVKQFLKEGIEGLRYKSKRPKTSPNQTPEVIEDRIEKVRKASGFGSQDIAVLLNESSRREGKIRKFWPSTINNILVRKGEIEREKQIQKGCQYFDWLHPNRLIQADLTKFNGVPILTMEDDGTRKGWAIALRDEKETSDTDGMEKLIKRKYDNLLTDNGSQFSRKNANIRKYCEKNVKEKHIWTSVHHPQTMGKLSAFQKALKRFLRHKLRRSRNKKIINHWIHVWEQWYNNGKFHSSIKSYPEEKYSGKRDEKWYENIVKALKLENVLTV